MILDVFDKKTRERIDTIRTFEFVQYTEYFNDIGNFSLTVPIDEESLPNLIIGNYILFDMYNDRVIMGIILDRNKESLESTKVSIKGKMVNRILSYRYFLETTKYDGNLFEIQRQMVIDLFINPKDERRKIEYISLSDGFPESDEISIQVNGDNLSYTLQDINSSYEYGYHLRPIISRYKDGEVSTNISNFVFECKKPTDRTMYNEFDNSPIVFSRQLNNLIELQFEEDASEYCTTAIVVSSGTGSGIKTLEVGDVETSGIDRIELYVNANSIQTGYDNSGGDVPDEPITPPEPEVEEVKQKINFKYNGEISTIDNYSNFYFYFDEFDISKFQKFIINKISVIARKNSTSTTNRQYYLFLGVLDSSNVEKKITLSTAIINSTSNVERELIENKEYTLDELKNESGIDIAKFKYIQINFAGSLSSSNIYWLNPLILDVELQYTS